MTAEEVESNFGVSMGVDHVGVHPRLPRKRSLSQQAAWREGYRRICNKSIAVFHIQGTQAQEVGVDVVMDHRASMSWKEPL